MTLSSDSAANDPPPQWKDAGVGLARRAFPEAQALGVSWCGAEHLLLAVLNPSEPTLASSVLAEVGLSHRQVAERLARRRYHPEPPKRDHVTSNPTWHQMIGTATGIALAAGSERITDEHVLVALLYSQVVDDEFEACGTTRAAVYDLCARRGLAVPPVAPTAPHPPPGPMGPRVYFPTAEHERVLAALNEQVEKGKHWGWNTDEAGVSWIDAEVGVDTASIVRGAVPDPHIDRGRAVRRGVGTQAPQRRNLTNTTLIMFSRRTREERIAACIEHGRSPFDDKTRAAEQGT